MSIVLLGSTSGSITLQEPAVAGTNTLSLPAVTGTLVVAGQNSAITAGTAVASTSGTSIDFTSIPSWVKRVTVMFSGVSTNGTSNPLVQIGTSSGVTTSGYVGTGSECGSSTAATSFTTGFGIRSAVSTNTVQGILILCCLNQTSNIWVASGTTAQPSSAFTHQIAGTVTLSATLDRVRVTTVNGTDAFDAGSINILYE
jgi:hypothetical protein